MPLVVPTREEIIAEFDAMLAERNPELVGTPLAAMMREMLVGTDTAAYHGLLDAPEIRAMPGAEFVGELGTGETLDRLAALYDVQPPRGEGEPDADFRPRVLKVIRGPEMTDAEKRAAAAKVGAFILGR